MGNVVVTIGWRKECSRTAEERERIEKDLTKMAKKHGLDRSSWIWNEVPGDYRFECEVSGFTLLWVKIPVALERCKKFHEEAKKYFMERFGQELAGQEIGHLPL